MLDKQTTHCGKRERGNSSTAQVKPLVPISSLLVAGLLSATLPTDAQVNVTQYHKHISRDGLYVDSAFTQSAAANLTRDLNFNGTIVGNVYTQALYIEGGPSGPMVIAVTESNNVYALNAVNGTIIWQRNVGAPVPTADLHCTEVGSMGIIGTPVVDLASRALFLDAMARGYKVRGRQTVDLSWNGATSNNIDIYCNSLLIATVPNIAGFYTDHIGVRGKGTYTYKVCEGDTENSSQVKVRLGSGG